MIREDINQQKLITIWRLSDMQPKYWETLFKWSKAFFYGLDRQDLIEELDRLIRVNIENRFAQPIDMVLYVYENLQALNSFTKIRHSDSDIVQVYKWQIRRWLKEIEDWIYQNITDLEPQIRFTRVKDIA